MAGVDQGGRRDAFDKADAKVRAMFRLLQGEPKDEAAWLT
jgi:hypothetical protein